MIIIKNIKIEDKNNKVRLISDIEYLNKLEKIWYEVDKCNKKYLCNERADSFLVALLLFAMEKGEDIKILDTPITEQLYYNLTKFFIPILSKKINKYKEIKIICEKTNDKLKNYNLNGTGISCGIDSLFTIQQNTNEDTSKDMQINCLTLFNMGSSGDKGGSVSEKLFFEREINGKKYAKEYGFSFISVNSNISEFINMNFVETHTLRNNSAALAIQKAFKNYHYSSGLSIYKFSISEKDTALYDTLILALLSNGNINFYPSGSPYNRVEKTKYVTLYKPSYKYLNVCTRGESNCGSCEKCIRTILAIYGFGQLEKYKKVFDLNKFYKNKNKYYIFMMRKVYSGNDWYKQIYQNLIDHDIKINLYIKIFAFFTNFEKLKKYICSKISESKKNKIKSFLKKIKVRNNEF